MEKSETDIYDEKLAIAAVSGILVQVYDLVDVRIKSKRDTRESLRSLMLAGLNTKS